MTFTRPCRQCGKSVESSLESCPFCGTAWPGEMSPDQPLLSAVLRRRDRTESLSRALLRSTAVGAATVLVLATTISLLGAL